MFTSILSKYGLNHNTCTIKPFGNGLINNTWKISDTKDEYILQRINNTVFKTPSDIADNIQAISTYLKKHHPDYLFVAPSINNGGKTMYVDEGGYFRVFPFIKNSHSIEVAVNPDQAYEAARQFARFTRLLSGFDAFKLKITLSDFHNLSLRYQQFIEALNNGNKIRIKEAASYIECVQKHFSIVKQFEKIRRNPDFKIRVIHHDTKISNVLFDENNKGLCVIDLDTVMPGYFISDVGDMIRTYLSVANEEEKDFDKIQIREEYFDAIVAGYLTEMKNELTETEKQSFVYSGKFMVYMQAMRFLTDYLNDDIYYGAKHPEHNYIRAGNQLCLLERIIEKEEKLQAMVL